MRFIKVTELDGSVFVPVNEIVFLKSKESETEIFLKNRADSLTVKEPLAEVIKNIRLSQPPGAGLPSERVIAVVQGERRITSHLSEETDHVVKEQQRTTRSQWRRP